ncbi:hypothetical protein A2311_04460 [candidate division WOR-1 bacterium RIFOXYB2_FULL_48_7]|uniref:Uncharacterized protein n=1 Tax=candidate division WOR-1 bacterium RIFOXYB2_FULL_48_7 TaxID=1802583 RepID=A0A1F4TIM5_UNCSA|nr:MAG: hypothetical protein A2311_04460 [candidate division WOR-1 bacterium RIFOXYB2_FULL_48_7]
MQQLTCPVCETKIDLPAKAKVGDRITCPVCFAQMGLFKHKDKFVLACALCKDPEFDPGKCGDCERRHDQKKLWESGKL